MDAKSPFKDPVGLEAEFERCWPWLEAALAAFAYTHNDVVWPTHKKEHVLALITNNLAFFWPSKTCAIVTYFVKYPTGLKQHTTWLAGGELKEIKRMTLHIEEWGRKQGCHMQFGYGREAWVRVLDGYKKHGTNRSKDLVLDHPSEWKNEQGQALWTRPW